MDISPTGSSKAAALLLLGVLVALGVFPLDIMLPSYPSLAAFFGIQINDVTLFVAVFTVGFAISQLIVGPLSDKYGRPLMLQCGLVIAVIGVTGCVLASDALTFSLFRCVQGMGCGCFVLAQAIVQDVFSPEDRQKVRIFLLSLSGVCISFSPLFGTYLQYALNWQGSFYVFGGLAALVFVQAALFFPPHNHAPQAARSQKLQIFQRYAEIFSSKPFVCSWLTSALAFSCHFGFIAVSPIIFLDLLDVSSQTYALVLLGYGSTYVAGGLLATRLSRTRPLDTQINLGLLIACASGVVMLVLMQFTLGIVTVMIPMILCTLGTTLVRPAAASRAMDLFAEKAGASSAAGGTLVFVTAGVVSMLLSYLPFSPLHSLCAFILFGTVVAYGLNRMAASEQHPSARTAAN